MAAGGVDPDEDVRLVVLPPPYMVDSLASRQVDALLRRRAVEFGRGRSGHRPYPALRLATSWCAPPRRCWRSGRAGRTKIRKSSPPWFAPPRAPPNSSSSRTIAPRPRASSAAPDRIGVDAELIQRTLDGRLKISPDGTMRESNRYLLVGREGAARPDPVQAAWLYAQMVRWGQTAFSADALRTAMAVSGRSFTTLRWEARRRAADDTRQDRRIRRAGVRRRRYCRASGRVQDWTQDLIGKLLEQYWAGRFEGLIIEASWSKFVAAGLGSHPSRNRNHRIIYIFLGRRVARNLYVAVQPAVADARWLTSKMDFRSNEAGRTALRELIRRFAGRTNSRGRIPLPVEAAEGGCRSFVAGHENRNPLRRFYRRAEALPRRLCHRPADQQGRPRPRRRRRRRGQENAEPGGPDAAHIKAQDRVIAAGKKLADQEKFKREQHPFDAYPRLKEQALDNAAPTPADNFRWRYFGLFYVAPTQNSYMCRLRIPNGILKHGNSRGSPISPSAMAAVMPMSRPAPTCRCAKSRRRMRSR